MLSKEYFFKGDGRGFNPEGEGYRTRVDIELAYDKAQMPLTFTKDVGQTTSYSTSKKLRRKGVASYEGIALKRMDHGKEEVGFLLTSYRWKSTRNCTWNRL